MLLESKDKCEFRIRRTYTSKNTGKTSFFYTFENDDIGSFELWCNKDFKLEKGKFYTLQFDMTSYNNELRYSLVGIA